MLPCITSSITQSILKAYWAFTGYAILGQVVEEIKEPLTSTLLTSICSGVTVVTLLYILTNFVYVAVLDPTEMTSSSAFAVVYGKKISPVLFYLIPCFVAVSSFGGLNANLMATSRLPLVASRQRHMPSLLSLISLDHVSPMPSIVFCCGLSVLLVATNSVETLILNTSYASVVGSALAIGALIYLRLTRDDLYLPLRLPLVLPILFLLIFLFLLVLPFTIPDKRLPIAVSFILIAAGIPVYFLLIRWQNKPKIFTKIDDLTLLIAQKLFNAIPETHATPPGDHKLD